MLEVPLIYEGLQWKSQTTCKILRIIRRDLDFLRLRTKHQSKNKNNKRKIKWIYQERKSIVIEMQNAFDGLHSNLDMTPEIISELEDLSTNKTNGEKKKKCGVRIYNYYRQLQNV